MPGYKVATVEPVKGGVVCPHCGLMLRDAVQTGDGCRLCETCFKEICLEPNCTCPRCGISVNPTQFWPDRAVQRDIVETLVRCTFHGHTHGCPWQGQLKHLEEHSQGCRYQPVQCPNPGCSELLAPDEMDEHIDQECQFRRVQCRYCQLEYLAASMEEHYTNCPKYPVTCYRCHISIDRDRLEEHQLGDCSVFEYQIPKLTEVTSLLPGPPTAFFTPCKDTPRFSAIDNSWVRGRNKEHTQEHLADPQDVFSHAQKITFLFKSYKQLESQYQSLMSLVQQSHQSGVAPQAINTRDELKQQVERLRNRLSRLEAVVESRQLQPRAITQMQQIQDIHQRPTAIFMMKYHEPELQLELPEESLDTHNGTLLWKRKRKRDAVEEDQVLSVKELVKLPIAAEWDRLGIQLDVPTDKLREFKRNHPHDVQSCLHAVFDWWLKNRESPTHSQLADALEAIDRRDLAKRFRIPKDKELPGHVKISRTF